MKKMAKFFVLFIALAFVIGCATTQEGQQQQVNNMGFGTLVGGAAGALIGAATGNAAKGALIGAGIGMAAGASAPIAPVRGRCPNGTTFFNGACFAPDRCKTRYYESGTDENGNFYQAYSETTCQ